MEQKVIFLIESDYLDKDLLGVAIEKNTDCRVFNFFSFEETLLYKCLNPKLIIHDNASVKHSEYNNVDFINIGKNRELTSIIDQTDILLELSSQIKKLVEA